MAVTQVTKDFLFTFERETAFGTSVNTAPIDLPTDDLQITIEPTLHTVPRSLGVRGVQDSAHWQDTTAGIVKATAKYPVTSSLMTTLVAGMFQKSADWAAAANIWTIYTPNYSDLPSLAANAGYYYTLTRRAQQTATSVKATSAFMTSLKLSLHPTNNEGLLFAESEWMGKAFTQQLANPSSTITATSLAAASLYKWSTLGAVSWDALGTPVVLTTDFIDFEVSIAHGAKFALGVASGDVAFPEWVVSGSFTVAANSNTEQLKADVNSKLISTSKVLRLAWGDGTVSSASELNLDVNAYLTSFEPDFSEGEKIKFGFTGMFAGTITSGAGSPFYYKLYL